jgi:response regulator of citrate/malate metabolism
MIYWENLLHNGYGSVKEMISKMHWEENLTIDEISEKLGVGRSTLQRKIVELEIKMKAKGGIAFSKFGKNGKRNHVTHSL